MFEFLFKYPLTVYRKGEFVFSSGWPVWLLIALIAAAGGALFWHVNKNRARFEGRRPLAVWAFQAASVALILFLLWQPAISINSLRNQQNVVAVLLDTSRSMALTEDGVRCEDMQRVEGKAPARVDGAEFTGDVRLPLPTFTEVAEMAGISRVLGGYHIQSDNTAGLEMGRKVAQHLFPKVRGYIEGKH